MVIEVSEAVVRTWRRSHEHVVLQFSLDGLDAQTAVGALERARGTAQVAMFGRVGLWEAVPLPDGSAALPVNFCDTEQDLRTLLGLLTASLDREGISGRLGEQRNDWSVFPDPLVDMPSLSTVVSLRLRSGAGASELGALTADITRADVPPETLQAAVRYALDWCDVPGGSHYADYGGVSLRLPKESLPTLLAAALRSLPTAPAIHIQCVDWPRRARQVAFASNARVIFTEAAADLQMVWPEFLQSATTTLRDNVPMGDYGFVVRSGGSPSTMEMLLYSSLSGVQRPDVEPNESLIARGLEDHLAPDAFAVQLLGPRYDVASLRSAVEWKLDELSEGAHLLSHGDPAAWLAARQPDADVLAAARRALDPILLQRSVADEIRRRRYGPPST